MSTRATRRNLQENAQVMLEVFRAVERRDARRFVELVHPEFEIHWPPSLPYGGTYRDLEVDARHDRPTWTTTWNSLQPTVAERRMDPRVVASGDGDEVVVLWHQRGLNPAGERFDGPVLGLYQLRDGRLARAQMFHFDTVALAGFLANAKRQATTPKPADP
jgi:ketosteroid isomerase-like protein